MWDYTTVEEVTAMDHVHVHKLICDFISGVVDVQSVVFSQEVITSPQFTLTCISTGGPATTVTWTRGSQTAVGERRSEVVNGVTAQYTHTLTVTGRQIGLYTCTVTNTVSPEDSESFTVSGIY